MLAAASNFCFSSRAVLVKKLNMSYPESIDEMNLFAYISLYGLLILIPITILIEGSELIDIIKGTALEVYTQEFDFQLLIVREIPANMFYLLLLLVVNGTMFACYNLSSYLVLKHVDLMTHSVLNVFRRVFIILVTSFYFAVYLSPFNLFGIGIAVVGVVLFGYCRAIDIPKSLL